jgi:hypothetical protein
MMPSSELESKLESKSSKDDNENDDDTHCDDQEHEHDHEEEEYDDEDEDEEGEGEQLSSSSSSKTAIVIKCILACVLLYGALIQVSLSLSSSVYYANPASLTEQQDEQEHEQDHLYYPRRRLSSTLTTHIVVIGDIIPSYMNTLITDLMERKKLFDDTPPEEIKYWFEYTGPLQVRFPFPFFLNLN